MGGSFCHPHPVGDNEQTAVASDANDNEQTENTLHSRLLLVVSAKKCRPLAGPTPEASSLIMHLIRQLSLHQYRLEPHQQRVP